MTTTMQLAMGRWYGMSLAGNRFAVKGTGPCALAFDGEYIWVANKGSKNVARLRACDGALVGAYAVPGSPVALAFDGGSVWVTTQQPSALVRLHAADGKVAGTIPLSAPGPMPMEGPYGLVFDGECLWVMWCAPYNGRLTRVRITSGVVDTFAIAGADPAPALAFDGSQIWVKGSDVAIERHNPATGALIGMVSAGAPASPVSCIFFDGTNLWAGSESGAFLERIDHQTGNVLNTYFTPTGPCFTKGLSFDGQYLWQNGGDRVRQIRRDGVVVSEHSMTGLLPAIGGAVGMVFDGAFTWVLGTGNELLKL